MKKLKLIAAFVLLTTLTGYGQSNKEENGKVDESEWNTYAKDNYSIRYPDYWQIDTSGSMGTNFFLFTPPATPEDPFRENINLIVQDLKGLDINMDQYLAISEEQVKTQLNEAEILKSERVKESGTEYHKILYTFEQQGMKLKIEQWFWIIKNSAYLVTFTCLEEEFENYQAEGEKVLESFKISKKK